MEPLTTIDAHLEPITGYNVSQKVEYEEGILHIFFEKSIALLHQAQSLKKIYDQVTAIHQIHKGILYIENSEGNFSFCNS